MNKFAVTAVLIPPGLALMWLPHIIQDRLLTPPDHLMAGPLSGGAGTVLSILMGIGYIIARRRLTRPWQADAAAVLLFLLAYSYSVTAHWFVTTDALTVAPGWLFPSATTPWTSVRARELHCIPAENGPAIIFTVQFTSGHTADLMQFISPHDEAGLQTFLTLTRHATTRLGDLQPCPASARALILKAQP